MLASFYFLKDRFLVLEGGVIGSLSWEVKNFLMKFRQSILKIGGILFVIWVKAHLFNDMNP